MRKHLKTIINSIVNLGTHAQSVSFYRTVTRTINIMAIVNIAICLIAGPIIHFYSQLDGVLLPALIEAVLFSLVLIFNRANCINIASLIMFLTHCASFIYFGVKFGPLSHVGVIWVYLIFIAYLVFKPNSLKALGMALSVISIILIEANYHFQLIPTWMMSVHDIEVVRWCIYGSVGCLAGSIMYVFMLRNAQQSRYNEMLIAQRTEQYEKAALKNIQVAVEHELFARETAHDINNPAHTIKTFVGKYLNVGRKSNALTVLKEDLQIIFTAGHTIELLTDNILSWTKLETGSNLIDDTKAVLNIGEIIKKQIELYDLRAKGKMVNIRLGTENLPEYIKFNEAVFIKIFANLLVNAIKFTKKCSFVDVKVFAHNSELFLSVTDEGQGISDEKIEKIFERYYTENNTFWSGTGLGLPLVKRLVHHLKGRLSVTSKVGCGSTFKVVLPFSVPTLEELNNALKKPIKETFSGVALVCDDDDGSRRSGEILMKQCGFDVLLADDISSALNTIEKFVPDILLLDVYMPDAHGVHPEQTAAIRILEYLSSDSRYSKIRTIIMTGLDDNPDLKEKFIENGAVGILKKPFSAHDLLNELRIIYGKASGNLVKG